MAVIIINGYRFSSKSPRVMQILEENNIPINTECKAGFCGQCKCKAVNPEAVTHNDNVIVNLASTEILPCSASVRDGHELELVLKI